MDDVRSGSYLNTLRSERDILNNCKNDLKNIMQMSTESMIRIREQRGRLINSRDRIDGLISGIPYVGEVVSKVKIKKKKDRLILSTLIGFLMFFVVWYLFG